MTFEIGSLKVDDKALTLTRDGMTIPASPKVVELLAALCAQNGSVASKEQLLARLWPHGHADDTALWQLVYLARKVLAESGAGSIETLPRRGYRLVAIPSPVARSREAWLRWVAAVLLLTATAAGIAFFALRPTRGDSLPPRALRAYNLGMYYLRLRTGTSAARAEAEFALVIRSTPENPLGYAGLSQAYVLEAVVKRRKRGELVSCAVSAGERALRLDPHSSVAQTAIAAAAYLSWISTSGSLRERGVATVDREFQRAIALNPDDATARMYYGNFLLRNGDTEKAFAQLQRAVDLDPTSSYANVLLAEAALSRHDANTAMHYAIEGLGFGTSDKEDALRTLGYAYDDEGRHQSALQTFRELTRYSPALGAQGMARVLHRQSGD